MASGADFRARVEAELDLSNADPAWMTLLDQTAAALDDVAALESLIETDGRTIEGSRGQRVIHPAIPELRLSRAAVARLLRELGLGEPTDPKTFNERQRAAARARWSGKSA